MPSSRRELLKQAGRAAAVALGSVAASRTGWAANAAHSQPVGSPATLPALTSRPSTAQIDPAIKSIVADVRAQEAMIDTAIQPELLVEMIDEGVRLATRANTAAQGWNKLLKPDDVIAIKFNSIGQEVMGTTIDFGTTLVESLKRAGFGPDRIMLVEAPPRLTAELKTRPCPFGFSGSKVSFGSGEDELAAFLQEATAIVNVPFLKSHNIAQMTCCLKNLSHAIIRQPRLCHANGCSPFVGDILALPQVRSKLKLHLVNAMRVAFDGGPIPSAEQLWSNSGILVSTDPVATDAVAADILDTYRATKKLAPTADRNGQVGYVHAAAARSLGTDDQDYITILKPTLF